LLDFLAPQGLLEGDPPSWYAVVRPNELRAVPYDGKPRAAIEGAEPRVLILEPGDESDVFVSKYDATLAYVTDVWYRTREAAIEELDTEFGKDLGPWMPIPEDVPHAETYVLGRISGSPQA
jgi:hypothetical protein